MRARTEVARVLRRSRTGRRLLNAQRAFRRDPDAPVSVPSTEPPSAPTSRCSGPGTGSHTARDVTSVDPDKFAMTFYSQFGEDAVLRGFFRRREEARLREPGAAPTDSPIGSGFYVDVGAYHPLRFSNTMHFYDAGWRGISIDASAGTTELFDRVRPRDTNLELAVSDVEGEVTFFSSGYGGRSVFNTIDPEQAEKYRSSGRVRPQKATTVSARRLEHILDEHLPPGQEISFLDVDVEGHDLAVLRSNDWTRYRPIVVVVESHLPTIDEVVQDATYAFLAGQGYELQSWVRPNMIFRRQEP